MNKLLDRSFDSEFGKVEHLVWYPWVGKGYKDGLHKVLIIGESQYATTENGAYDEETAASFLQNKETTREFVYNTITKEVIPARFYNMLLSTFISDNQKESFWNNVSLYHFFQEPDKAVSNNRHSKEECLKAWNLWRKIIEILQPDICIFCGTGLARHYAAWNESIGKKSDWQDVPADFCRPNQQPPIRGKFDISPAKTTNLLFINHPSSHGYSPEKWHEFLKQQLPGAMKWLDQQ